MTRCLHEPTEVLPSEPGESYQQPELLPNGDELFYRKGNRMMSVPIRTVPHFTPGKPTLVFEKSYAWGGTMSTYDVTPDGQHFIMIEHDESEAPHRLNVVLNWFDELRRRVPVD